VGLTPEEQAHLTVDQKIKLQELEYMRRSSVSHSILASSAVQANVQNAYRPPVNTYNQVYYYGR